MPLTPLDPVYDDDKGAYAKPEGSGFVNPALLRNTIPHVESEATFGLGLSFGAGGPTSVQDYANQPTLQAVQSPIQRVGTMTSPQIEYLPSSMPPLDPHTAWPFNLSTPIPAPPVRNPAVAPLTIANLSSLNTNSALNPSWTHGFPDYRDQLSASTYTLPTAPLLSSSTSFDAPAFQGISSFNSISLPAVPPNTSLAPYLSPTAPFSTPGPIRTPLRRPVQPLDPQSHLSMGGGASMPPPMIRRITTPTSRRRFHPTGGPMAASISLPIHEHVGAGGLILDDGFGPLLGAGLGGGKKRSPTDKKARFKPTPEQLEVLLKAYEENQ